MEYRFRELIWIIPGSLSQFKSSSAQSWHSLCIYVWILSPHEVSLINSWEQLKYINKPWSEKIGGEEWS